MPKAPRKSFTSMAGGVVPTMDEARKRRVRSEEPDSDDEEMVLDELPKKVKKKARKSDKTARKSAQTPPPPASENETMPDQHEPTIEPDQDRPMSLPNEPRADMENEENPPEDEPLEPEYHEGDAMAIKQELARERWADEPGEQEGKYLTTNNQELD